VTLKDEIKEHAIQHLDMDYCGITGVDRLSGAPEGTRPTDLLPGAKSVVVMAVKLSLGAVQTIFRAHEDGLRQAMSIYGSYAYSLFPNYYLKYAAYNMARFLEKRGHMSTPVPSGPGSAGAPLSNRHAAVAAGIGIMGWLGIVIAPDYGPRIRIVSVITRAEIEPDPMYSGPELCKPEKCGICVKVCPTHAISPTHAKTVTMGGREFKYGWVDFNACRVGAEGLTKKTLGLRDIDVPENPTMEDVEEARRQMDPRQRGEVIGGSPLYHCGKCLAYCPVGPKGWLKTVSNLKLK
jgi:epoxyqueuosine reductase QueG